MIDPLDLFPWDYNKLNSYSPIENSQPNTQTLLRHQHIRASEGGQISQARGEERKRSRDGCSDVAKAPCRTWEEGELGCGMHSLKPRAFLPEYSFLRSVYTMVESNNQGRDRIQRCDRCDRGVTPTSRYCQADNWVMGPGCLSPPSQSSPPFTLPELDASPRGNCSSQCQATQQGVCSPGNRGDTYCSWS